MTTNTNLVLKTPATITSVTKDEAKKNARIDFTDDDDIIDDLTKLADEQIEVDTGQIITQKTYTLFSKITDIPNRRIKLLKNTHTINSVKLPGGATVPSDNYDIRTHFFDYLVFNDDYNIDTTFKYEIELVAGYDAVAKIPMAIRQAALLLITHFYQNRSATGFTQQHEIPMGYQSLLAAHIFRERM